MAKLDFCVGCGGWIAAETGMMRQGRPRSHRRAKGGQRALQQPRIEIL